MAGAVDWRDPVTLRFRPAAPLTPSASFTVTVANSFAAMDGGRARWTIDGRPQRSSRWALARDPHLIRAVDGAGTVRRSG